MDIVGCWFRFLVQQTSHRFKQNPRPDIFVSTLDLREDEQNSRWHWWPVSCAVGQDCFVVIASDGVWGPVTDGEARGFCEDCEVSCAVKKALKCRPLCHPTKSDSETALKLKCLQVSSSISNQSRAQVSEESGSSHRCQCPPRGRRGRLFGFQRHRRPETSDISDEFKASWLQFLPSKYQILHTFTL